jgi:hypothetical protein
MTTVKVQTLRNRIYDNSHELFVEYLLNDDLSVTEVHVTASTEEGKKWLTANHEAVLDKITRQIKNQH